MSGVAALVVKSGWTRSYDDPIRVARGAVVSVERRESEWLGWLWCTASHGKTGWVPEVFMEVEGDRGRLLCDYDAIELTVTSGECLQGFQQVNGWVWCRNNAGQSGWVPIDSVMATTG